jgi:hypothetical protein
MYWLVEASHIIWEKDNYMTLILNIIKSVI